MRDPLTSALMTAKRIAPINWAGVPTPLQGRVSAVCRSLAECQDLVAWYGDAAFCPFQPVLLLLPVGLPISINGDGYASAAELQDCAVTLWERRISGEGAFNIDEARERAGLPERGKVDQLIREALWDAAQKHKASPVTNPGRQPEYPNPTGKVQFAQHPGVPYQTGVTDD